MTELACEFVGGPQDGEVLMIRPGRDGCPEGEVFVMGLLHDPATWRESAAATSPTEVATVRLVYRRDSISDDSHRWRYLFGGES
jgi:hypothetical protein